MLCSFVVQLLQCGLFLVFFSNEHVSRACWQQTCFLSISLCGTTRSARCVMACSVQRCLNVVISYVACLLVVVVIRPSCAFYRALALVTLLCSYAINCSSISFQPKLISESTCPYLRFCGRRSNVCLSSLKLLELAASSNMRHRLILFYCDQK